MQREVGVEPLPHGRALARGVGLEGNVLVGTVPLDMPKVGVREIRLVGGYLGHREPLGRGVQEPRQHRGVVDVARGDLKAGDDVRLGSAHDMGLEPVALRLLFSPLCVVPTVEPQVENPVPSAAKSDSTTLSGAALRSIRSVMSGVRSGFEMYLLTVVNVGGALISPCRLACRTSQ